MSAQQARQASRGAPAVIAVRQGELGEGLEVALEIADVETPLVRRKRTPSTCRRRGSERGWRRSTGSRPPCPAASSASLSKIARAEDVARRRRPGCWGPRPTAGFSIRSSSSNTSSPALPRLGDAVVDHLLRRHLLEGHHRVRAAADSKSLDHRPHDVRLGVQADDRVAQGHHERLAAHHRPGTEHGVAQPSWRRCRV